MMTWTLYLLVFLVPSGEWGMVKHNTYTQEHECKRAEAIAWQIPQPESMPLVGSVCKESIDV